MISVDEKQDSKAMSCGSVDSLVWTLHQGEECLKWAGGGTPPLMAVVEENEMSLRTTLNPFNFTGTGHLTMTVGCQKERDTETLHK